MNVKSDLNAKSTYLQIAHYLKFGICNLSIEVIENVYKFLVIEKTSFIFDNFCFCNNIQQYIHNIPPDATRPLFIVTSQSYRNRLSALTKIPIDTFASDAAVHFIRDQSSKLNLDIGHAPELAQKLSNLLLSLHQCIAYIKSRKVSIQTYLGYC